MTADHALSPSPLPALSVVMVSYFTGPALGTAIDSVLGQPEAAALVLVDNGNPPAVTAALVRRAADEPRLVLLTGHGNVGFAAGCNRGAAAARGEILLLLNPDCRLKPEALARLLDEAVRLERPWLLGCRIVGPQGHEARGGRRHALTPLRALIEGAGLYRLGLGRWRLNRHAEPLPGSTVAMGAVSGAAMAVPAADYRALGGLDEGYFLHVEDLDLCVRLAAAGGRIVYAPSVEIVHEGGTSAAPAAFVERHKARGLARYFRLHRAGPAWDVLAGLVIAAAYGRAWLAGRREARRAHIKLGRNGPGS
ncbi:MAG TPA: glycosyltransferase family 2 protein [Alphaproteobacteria bacterium]|nr:glycosyltransferase family 2 protein [Alphaproteobacteria bacterium]